MKKKYGKSDFVKILKDYDIGDYLKSEYLEHIHENVVAFWTGKGKFVLKKLRDVKIEDYVEQMKFIDFLYSKDVKVVKNIKSKNGEEIVEYGGEKIIIQEFVEGIHPKDLSLKLIDKIARNIAYMNKISLDSKYIGKIDKKYSRKDFSGMDLSEGILEIQDKNIEKLNGVDKGNFKVCRIHGDLSEGNILAGDSEVKAFIDFDDSEIDYVINEVAIFIAHAFLKRRVGILEEEIKIFLKEYEKILKLGDGEKGVVYDLVMYRLFCMLHWYKRFYAHDLSRFEYEIKRLCDIILMFDLWMKK